MFAVFLNMIKKLLRSHKKLVAYQIINIELQLLKMHPIRCLILLHWISMLRLFYLKIIIQ